MNFSLLIAFILGIVLTIIGCYFMDWNSFFQIFVNSSNTFNTSDEVSSAAFLIFMGVFLAIIAIQLWLVIKKEESGNESKKKYNKIIQTFLPVILIFIGLGSITLMFVEEGSARFEVLFDELGIFAIIPIALVILGIVALFPKCFKKHKYSVLRIDKIIGYGNEKEIHFIDDKKQNREKIGLGGYRYIYYSKSSDFEVNQLYKFELYKYGIVQSSKTIDDKLYIVLDMYKDSDFEFCSNSSVDL